MLWEYRNANVHVNPKTEELLPDEEKARVQRVNNPYTIQAFDWNRRLKSIDVQLQVTHATPLTKKGFAWRRDRRKPETSFHAIFSGNAFERRRDKTGAEVGRFPFQIKAQLGDGGFEFDKDEQKAFYLPPLNLRTHPLAERIQTPSDAFKRHILMFGLQFGNLERRMNQGQIPHAKVPNLRQEYIHQAEHAIEQGEFSQKEKAELRQVLYQKIGHPQKG